jgi:cytochrome c-type biogenesis protein CcmH
MKQRQVIFTVILIIGLLAGFSQTVVAQDPQPTPSDNEVNRVAKQLFCPVCENIPLDVCPTQACSEWRELIREKLAEGWTDEQIRQYFAAQYGDRVLAEPPRQGLNWLVYLLPPVFFVIGAIILWRVLLSMRAPKTQAAEVKSPQQQPNQDDPYLARFEEELKKDE